MKLQVARMVLFKDLHASVRFKDGSLRIAFVNLEWDIETWKSFGDPFGSFSHTCPPYYVRDGRLCNFLKQLLHCYNCILFIRYHKYVFWGSSCFPLHSLVISRCLSSILRPMASSPSVVTPRTKSMIYLFPSVPPVRISFDSRVNFLP